MRHPDERAGTQNTQVRDAVAVVIWWIPRVCILCTLYLTDTAPIDQNTLNIPDAAAVNVLHLQCNSRTVQDIAFISGILRRHVLLMHGQGLKIPRDGRCNCCGQVSNISPLPSLHLMIFIAMLLHSFTPNKLGFNRWLVFDTSDFLAKSQCHSAQ